MQSSSIRSVAVLSLACAVPAFAQQAPATLQDCARVTAPDQRLLCYDQLALRPNVPAAPSAPAVAPNAAPPTAQPALPATLAVEAARITPAPFSLDDYWELDAAHKRGLFNFRPHQNNYLIATYTARPNNAPYRPIRRVTGNQTDLSHGELVFQLSFKLKLLENTFGLPLDLWAGYTQNSFWQANNQQASSPFRETNYQPELMAVTPLHFSVLGMNARFLNLGLVHQSNGQTGTLSRSWNRVYAQVGLERGPFTLTGRYWARLSESNRTDDNPDIVDYLGRGDLVGVYRVNGHELTAALRHNFHTGRGATQLSWAFPLRGPLKGYVQYFNGYGQSLIDYNYFQRTIGAGVMVKF